MNKKEPLKYGDRVAVYGNISSAAREVCKVLGVYPDGTLKVFLETNTPNDHFSVNIKQCRRLKKKEKRENE